MKNRDRAIQADQGKYDSAINYLYSLQHHGIKLGLHNIRRVLELLGDPQQSFKTIHIAGTNGKGSTSSCIASMLDKAGLKAGLFTSPHLVSFTERIRVNGVEISRWDVVSITNHIRELISTEEELTPTFFEFVTAIAFYYFKMMGVQWAVVETGMGGRLDSTNILDPEVTVITRVAMDHMEFLGGSLREIAGEKAGIIKEGTPVILGLQHDEVQEVILDVASSKKSPVQLYGKDFHSSTLDIGIHGSRFDYMSDHEMNDLYVPLCGAFQVENASLAIRAVELLQEVHVAESVIRNGLSVTRWEGRCELYNWKYPILFDGAHNLDAAGNLYKTLMDIHLKEYNNIILLIGSMGDKDVEGFLRILMPSARLTVFTTLQFERAAASENLKTIADELGAESVAVDTMAEALKTVESHYREGDLVVITGSFYTVGEAKGHIGSDTSLIGLTEFR